MEPIALLQVAVGVGLTTAAWLVPRRIARCRKPRFAALLLDAAPIAIGAGLLALATGRPLFSGIVIAALGAGFALADHTMRLTLREPVVFSESVELPQLFSHPHLYLPFAAPGLVLAGAAAAASIAPPLPLFDPPLSPPRPTLAPTPLALGPA